MSEVNKTVTVVTRATKAMSKAVGDLTKTAGDLQALVAVSEELTSEIEFKTSELSALEDRTAEDLRKAKAELSLKVLENEDSVLASLLNDRKLVPIDRNELGDLRANLQDALAENEDTINAAVGKAKGMAESKMAAALKEQALQHDVETAQLEATKVSLQDKNTMLEQQLVDMKEMLTKEREARVEMSANATQPVVNVTSSK